MPDGISTNKTKHKASWSTLSYEQAYVPDNIAFCESKSLLFYLAHIARSEKDGQHSRAGHVCFIAMNNYTYTYTCRIIFNTITTSGHSSFEKIYLSLYWKGCVWEGVGDWTKTATYWPPPTLWLSQPFFPVLLGCSTGGQGAQPLLGHGFHSSIFSPINTNFLCTELFYCFTPTQFKPSTVKVIPWHPRLDAPGIYTGAFLILTAWSDRRSICNLCLGLKPLHENPAIKKILCQFLSYRRQK